ncbi:sulfite exporter TauE/SafE family protein [Chlorobium phaeovibrioides]|uniref:Probable membrane transporter protein n=2 Tax=Chlorobium phaeovibrioides TaxID=1094 RepID=A0A432AVW1_CHLPH|nr:sulfite exporter TauE/SafE family protein [Chlorobium phaeovibrioides]HCD35985.1 sulfite exporter TauE/SafE family protein [Chlorobium sp.]KAA6230663.1 sulfite exporter TauE/SafE family protein [Chlorobium phaeovibrioides]MWV54389.1 TSUP family transporter [Chlorobium phaeovibrioides]QEQ56501.1 sulfite exporter TauE/SafE family protein [Chlorobium phaeovibrioides]RTY35779.1 sulfite exporter TauE/SafE family protein [Chlorobium phaeovibrioides]
MEIPYAQVITMLLIGSLAGILSGMFGIGGGVIIVPALVLLLGMTQHTANATSLVALLLPVGILGALEYYRAGKISMDNVWLGLILAVGLFGGAYFGAKIATHLSGSVLRKAFAVFTGIVALRLWFK